MMPTDRFDRQLPALLEELARPRTPDYFDDLLGQTARTRQRPAWTLIERWLPMVDIARRPVLVRQVPFRPIVVLILMTLLLAASLVFIIGSQHRPAPPFGPAANGVIAYAADGEIYTADPATGQAKLVVSGPDTDLRPIFSPDGTRLAFERKNQRTGPGHLYVANTDGSDLTRVTPEPLMATNSYTFSPDGREILISAGPEGAETLSLAKADGSAIRALSIGTLFAHEPAYRPPSGEEIVFVGNEPGVAATGLYAVKPDGTGRRTIVPPANLIMSDPIWSPDGEQIAYSAWAVDYETGGSLVRGFVVSPDGQANRVLRPIPDNDLNAVADWSNDGARLLITGCHYAVATDVCEDTTALVAVDGIGADVKIQAIESALGADGISYQWAPDDRSILATQIDTEGQPMPGSLVMDSITGRSRPVSWSGGGGSSWQRLAP
jgi:Tol biopolymer transport system component